jgi:predicted nuclease of predicted toxin-antitoxin system
VKFLVDRCAGSRLAAWLRTEGHDVLESRERGSDPGDKALLAWAREEQRVLVTLDTDFGKLLFLDKVEPCGLVRLPDVPAIRRIEITRQVIERYAEELQAGAIITVRGSRIRVTRVSR